MASRNYEVRATASFAADLRESTAYYLERAGERSAGRFLEDYEGFCRLAAAVPGHGSLIADTSLRWRKVGAFIAVYDVDDGARTVTLLRLYHMSANWRPRALRLASAE
jgi:plasmid stabilization system protein ParE